MHVHETYSHAQNANLNAQGDADDGQAAIEDLAPGPAMVNVPHAGNANAAVPAPAPVNANEDEPVIALANEANVHHFQGAQNQANEANAVVGGVDFNNLQLHHALVWVRADDGTMVLAWVHPAMAYLFLQVA